MGKHLGRGPGRPKGSKNRALNVDEKESTGHFVQQKMQFPSLRDNSININAISLSNDAQKAVDASNVKLDRRVANCDSFC